MNGDEINKSSKLHQIDKGENYSEDVYTMHKSFPIELQKTELSWIFLEIKL